MFTILQKEQLLLLSKSEYKNVSDIHDAPIMFIIYMMNTIQVKNGSVVFL